MKITGDTHYPATFPVPKALNPISVPDLKPTRRRTRNPSLSRVRKPGAPGQRRSRPETPLLKWKVEDRERSKNVEVEEEEEEEAAEEAQEASAGNGGDFGQEACCWTVASAGAGQCCRWRWREFGSVRVSAWCKECGSPVSCPS
ncbi:hypothetical protein LWI29_031408 [Acer saccharum]|uniref:Uncharacterized protein n=1 Tax=Acer saccharum TaxID=4024 RepID=A0AA39T4Z3_ACESA|nr:hypothetical protein LWI29_031408 [Acer saccharum]